MKIFIGMETSGELRRRFQELGHHAISCDLLPADDSGEGHIVGDVFETLEMLQNFGWVPDVGIFHPTCTYLTISAEWAYKNPDFERYPNGGYHQKLRPETLFGAERRKARADALNDVQRIFQLQIPMKIVENPIGVIGSRLLPASQIVQPYEFGDDASKATCFWILNEFGEPLENVKLPVNPSNRVKGRLVNGIERWANQTDTRQNRLSPGKDRWQKRSKTFPGIAQAIVRLVVDNETNRN